MESKCVRTTGAFHIATSAVVIDAVSKVFNQGAANQVDALADSSVNLLCRPWVKTSDYWTVRWDLTRHVKERFDAGGISFPFPQRDVHVKGGTPEGAA